MNNLDIGTAVKDEQKALCEHIALCRRGEPLPTSQQTVQVSSRLDNSALLSACSSGVYRDMPQTGNSKRSLSAAQSV